MSVAWFNLNEIPPYLKEWTEMPMPKFRQRLEAHEERKFQSALRTMEGRSMNIEAGLYSQMQNSKNFVEGVICKKCMKF